MTNLAHVNIRTADLEKSVAFYRDVLGLRPGPAATRPQSSDHVWMSDQQGNPCIHLQRTDAPRADSMMRPGVHHVALACSNADSWRDKLQSMRIDCQEREFPAAKLVQINIVDPDGVQIELLFEAA